MAVMACQTGDDSASKMDLAEEQTTVTQHLPSISVNSRPEGTSPSDVEIDSSHVTKPDSSSQPTQVESDKESVKQIMAQHKKKKQGPVRKPARRSKWNAENIMIDSKSPLATCDLRTILSNPMAWDVLDADEKTEVLALFPDREHIIESESDGPRPNFQALLNDDSFRHDCAAYTENVAEGRHDPDWLAQAWSAHERRKAGDFDDFLVKKFEEDWEVKLPGELKPQRVAAPTTSQQTETIGDDDASMKDLQPENDREICSNDLQ